MTTERVRDLLARVHDTNWRRQTAACTHVDQDEHVAIKADGALIIDCMADDGYAAMVCAAPDLALDLLDARRELDEARGQALHWSTLNSETGNRCYQLQCLQNGVAHGIARVREDSDLWFVTDRNRHIPALSAFDSAHEAARAVCDALGLPLIAAGLPGEDGAS